MQSTKHEECQHGNDITQWCGECWVLSDTTPEAKRNTLSCMKREVNSEAHIKRVRLLVDLARNVAGCDDSLLRSADLNVLRATIREWRAQAREALP